MAKDWGWLIRYVLVIVVALILGAAIGELDLFTKTALGAPKLKLTAANLARFLGYGSALTLLWLLAERAARELRSQDGWKRPVSFFVVPLATLIVVPAAHQILLLVFGGLIGPDLRKIYDWIFILGTTVSAIWLAVAMFQHLESLVEELRAGSKGRQA
jgi:threonine/homoserine/homoserine lactone efflux protein